MTQYRFDAQFDPPAPVLPVHVSGIAEHGPAVLLQMLVDTGADCSLIPEKIARTLRLPLVDKLSIVGVGGSILPVPVHAARLRIGALRVLARVAAYGDEALLGRELLNLLVMRFEGPELLLHVPGRPTPKKPLRR
jgi:predicted aspartyl protease